MFESRLIIPYSSDAPAPNSHAPVPRKRPVSFDVEARLVVQLRGVKTILPTSECQVALLTKCPSPEGGGVVEVADDPGYRRQAVRFEPMNKSVVGGTLWNATSVVFGPLQSDPALVAAVGVYVEGKLWFYGRAQPSTVDPASSVEGCLAVPACALQLKMT